MNKQYAKGDKVQHIKRPRVGVVTARSRFGNWVHVRWSGEKINTRERIISNLLQKV